MKGYSGALLILPFDHRSSFSSTLLGFTEPLSKKEKAIVNVYKKIVYDGFLMVWKKSKQKHELGILVDEEYGKDILIDALAKDIVTAMSVEQSGKQAFQFNYGNNFGKHLQAFPGTIAKVLVRYNPLNKEINQQQLPRLKRFHDYCSKQGITYMFEMLCKPTPAQSKRYGTKEQYEKKKRPEVILASMKELMKAGILPDIWKLEAVPHKKQWKAIVQQARSKKGLEQVAVIILGGGESVAVVKKEIQEAHRTPGVQGFAIGRTIFKDALVAYKEKKISRTEAVKKIAQRYGLFVRTWENSQRF